MKVLTRAVYLALVMAKKRKLKYSLTMEYCPEEDLLEFIEERIDELGESDEIIKVEKLNKEDLMDYLIEHEKDIAIA